MSTEIRARDVVEYVFEIAPQPSWAWENVYEAPGPDRVITGFGIAWHLSANMLRQFPSLGLNLGLTHELLCYPVPETYAWGPPMPSDQIPVNILKMSLCKELGITVHRFHSNIDLVEWGMPHAVVDQLGWTHCKQDWSRGVPVIDIPPTTLGDLAIHLKDKLSIPFVRHRGDLSRKVHRAALAWGGLCQHWIAASCALPLGFDVLIGGDIIDSVARFGDEHDFVVLDAMHHATEWEAMRRLGRKIVERFPSLHCVEFDNHSPWDGAV